MNKYYLGYVLQLNLDTSVYDYFEISVKFTEILYLEILVDKIQINTYCSVKYQRKCMIIILSCYYTEVSKYKLLMQIKL